MVLRILIAIGLLIFSPVTAQAQTSAIATAALVSDTPVVTAGEPFSLSLTLSPQAGWHTYYKNPGDAGVATSIEWQLPPGFTAGDIAWPHPKRFDEAGLTTYGYDSDVALSSLVTPPGVINSEEVLIKAKASWLVCKDICIPESQELSVRLPVKDAAAKNRGAQPDTTVHAGDASITWILLLAFIGGLILNVMPCVLPVLTLKLLALTRLRQSGGKVRLQGLAYSAGVLTCFLTLAALLVLLQQGGARLGWGFHLQSPVFVTTLAYVMFAVGLSLSGLFHLPAFFGGVQVKDGALGSFFTGLLASLVATPCTAPFMAAAVGYALVSPPAVTFIVFAVMGFGLSLPFLILSFIPGLACMLPRPGAWMLTVKSLSAGLMFASAVWFLWVASLQVDAKGVALILSGLAMLAVSLSLPARYKGFAWLGLAVSAATLLWLSPRAMTEENARSVMNEIASSQAKGTPLFVNVTAEWCLTCKLNEKATLNTDKVAQAFCGYGVKTVVADWTRKDGEITTLLASIGRRGVPTYIFYPPHAKPVLLPQILTPAMIIETLGSPDYALTFNRCD